ACFVEMTGYPGSAFLGKHRARYGAFESVTIRLNRAGGADLYTGVSPFGQGTETSFAQLAAHTIGISPADVVVHAGDTVGTPYNTGSFASRTTIAGAGAIAAAGREIRGKAIRIAAHLLGVEAARLDIVAGEVRATDEPAVRITLGDVATEAFFGHRLPEEEDPGIESTAYFDPPANTFGYGTAAAIVEVDPRTGEFAVQRFVLAHDCGTQVERVTRCIPGVESFEDLGEDKYRVRITQKVGSIGATFDLKAQLDRKDPMHAFEFSAVGRSVKGAAGDMRSKNRLELAQSDD